MLKDLLVDKKSPKAVGEKNLQPGQKSPETNTAQPVFQFIETGADENQPQTEEKKAPEKKSPIDDYEEDEEALANEFYSQQ